MASSNARDLIVALIILLVGGWAVMKIAVVLGY
jgi:hypothetical protein